MNDSTGIDSSLAAPLSASPSGVTSGTPQFSTAEYSHIPGTERCRVCNNLIGGDYFRVNGQMACAQCAGDAQAGQPRDSHTAYSRGLLLGIGAAVIGMAAYATFAIVTGWTIGYLALGVGWLIAKAMKKGSNGLGGRRYQVTAVLLTYAAISLAAVPVIISEGLKNKASEKQSQADVTVTAPSGDANGPQPTEAKEKMSFGAAIGQLVWVGLASPFLALSDPVHGAIGLFILFIGLRIAWRLTATEPLRVEGPFANTGVA